MEQGSARFEIFLRLVLTGFPCDPEQISKILGVVPSRTWGKGQPRYEKNPAIRHKENGWVWTCPVNPIDASVDEVLSKAREEINPTKFGMLPEKTSATLSFAVYAFAEVPALYVTASDVSWISSLGTALDFDVYDLREESAGELTGHLSKLTHPNSRR